MSELLIGCGNKRVKRFSMNDSLDWVGLVTMDHDPIWRSSSSAITIASPTAIKTKRVQSKR